MLLPGYCSSAICCSERQPRGNAFQ